MGYLTNFIVYFLAMIGIIILALFVYKKFNISNFSGTRNNILNVEDTLCLTPRKTLYVIRSGKERFLIAGDTENTTLISKLEDTSYEQEPVYTRTRRSPQHNADLSEAAIRAQDNISPIKKPIMKEIISKLNF